MKIIKPKLPQLPARRDVSEWAGFALVVAGLVCLGVFLSGALLGTTLGLLAAGAVLILAGNV